MIAGRLEIVDRAAELARSTNLYSEARQLALLASALISFGITGRRRTRRN